MSGRILALILVLSAAVAGAAMYYLQVHAFYTRLPADTVMRFVTPGALAPVSLRTADFQGIDASSSPLRFRACFRLADPRALDGAQPVADPTPLVGPGWFGCYDAAAVARALADGQARAVLSEPEIARGVDRIIAVWPDGRAVAWHQLNGTLEK
jgi:hypothetical protein